MSRCVLARCYHCFTKSIPPKNELIAERLARKVRTGHFSNLSISEKPKLLSVTTYGNAGAQVKAPITLMQQRGMSDKAENFEERTAPSLLGRLVISLKSMMSSQEIDTTIPIQNLQVGGTILVLGISDNVSYEEIFEMAKLDDSFYSFYKVLELHLWMMLQRLQRDGNDGIVAGMALVSAMWSDLDPRIKLAGAQMKQKKDGFHYFNNHFQSAMFRYDEALLVGTDIALAHALWLNIYDAKDCDPRCLEFMVEYTRKQMHYLQSIDSKILLCGEQFSFLPVEVDEETRKRTEERQYKIPRYTRKINF
ncbi:ubiquinol-cytochrome c reductase complex assembly factor 1-like [Saccostrea echinata]|uniref:ubiquinol-cytochrome c reductase complex assembly factor 1-like n=1 Tax=Saccostrea echinata TaxID=191078 RepID=UPI002A7EEC74|nr:ubiquinol-cytochrome c reductase complex assembly factor 1-like [Saccostrea echinata]